MQFLVHTIHEKTNMSKQLAGSKGLGVGSLQSLRSDLGFRDHFSKPGLKRHSQGGIVDKQFDRIAFSMQI